MKIKVSKSQILARYKFQVRYEKKCFKKNSQKIIQSWQTMCDSYRINEESIEVINETIKQEEAVNNQNDSKSGGTPTGNGNDKPAPASGPSNKAVAKLFYATGGLFDSMQ